MENHKNKYFMKLALLQAGKVLGKTKKNPAVGCVIVKNNCLVSAGHTGINGIPHAEYNAIKFGKTKTEKSDLYVTLEPCAMCAQAISLARIQRLYFGASDKKSGAVENGVRLYNNPNCHHRPEVYGGLNALRAEELLQNFFRLRR